MQNLFFSFNSYNYKGNYENIVVHNNGIQLIIISNKDYDRKISHMEEYLDIDYGDTGLPSDFFDKTPHKKYRLVKDRKNEIEINNLSVHFFTDQFNNMYCMSDNYILPIARYPMIRYAEFGNFPKLHTLEKCSNYNFPHSTSTYTNKIIHNIFDNYDNSFHENVELSFCKFCAINSKQDEILFNGWFFKLEA